MNVDPNVAASWVIAFVAACAAAFERSRSIKHVAHSTEVEKKQGAFNEVIAAKEELIKISRETVHALQEKLAAEHAEFLQYRKDVHDRSEKIQAANLKLTEENALLHSRTDITPLIDFQKTQDAIFERIIKSLEENAVINRENVQINQKVLQALSALVANQAKK